MAKTKTTTAKIATAAAPKPDELADALIAAGLVPNPHILDLNGGLTVPHVADLPSPWNLPSRLFQFPIVTSKQAEDGTRSISLRHPLLADHPFAQQVAAAIGRPLDVTNAHGWNGFSSGQWWHAVDLISHGRWRELLETRHFTTEDHIAGAVAYGLRYSAHDSKKVGGYIRVTDARQIMHAIGSIEPTGRNSTLSDFMKPSPCKQDGGKTEWPINRNSAADSYAEAWGFIQGIEAGWFAYDRSGFLNWSEAGRDRYAAGSSAVYIEASGQAAFAF